MRVWALIFFLLGSAFASQFCFPKPVRFPIDDTATYPMNMIGQEFDVKRFGYILSGLPETENDFAALGTPLTGVEVSFSWDLLSSPLAMKLSAARSLDAENHFVQTGSFRLTATFNGNVDDPEADDSAPDQKLSIGLTCDGGETVALTFTYPFSRADLATTADWFIAYTINGEHQLVISASNDAATLGDEESKLGSDSPALPQACVDALTAEQAKGGAEGATVTFGMNQVSHADATATFHPYSIDQSKLRLVSSSGIGYIFNGAPLPAYDGGNNPVAYEFPADSCVYTANYLFGDIDRSIASSNCYSDPASMTRQVDCMFPATLDATAECGSQYCCHYPEDGKCLASSLNVCTLSSTSPHDMAQDATTQITIEGTVLTTSNSGDYTSVYLGEEVEFSCKPAADGEKYLLRYDASVPDIAQFGDFTSISFKCLIEKDSAKTTDIKGLYDLVKCEAACTKPEIHDSVEIDAVFTDEDPYKPSGTVYTFTCKDGFGTSIGGTDAGTKTCSGSITSYINEVQCYQCAAPNVDPAKIASYLTATAIPTSNIVYKCDDGYSFERPKADQRNEVEKACSYSSSSSTVALDQSQEQCLKDCPLTLPADHGLVLEFDGEVTTIESIPQDERYDLRCADETHQLAFGQDDRVDCDEPAEGEEPATIAIKGCHKPCSVVDLKNTYMVESKNTPDAGFTKFRQNEVKFGAPLKLTGCVGDDFHLLFTEKDNNEITCSDEYYDFEAGIFKNLIQCYQSCALPSTILDVYTVGDLLNNGGDDSLAAQSMVDDGELLPNTEVQFVCRRADTTVAGTKGNTFTAFCGTSGTAIELKQCYPSCSVSEISNPNENSIVQSHTDASATKVALAEHVDIVCSGADYRLAHNTALNKIEEYATCKLQSGAETVSALLELEVSDSPPDPNWCLAVPKVKPLAEGAKTSSGAFSFLAHVILPSDRDSSGDFAIEFVGVMASGGSVSICTITGIVDGTDEYECTYNIPQTAGWEDKLKNGYGLAARSISYGGKSYTINPDSEVGGYYGGPPALETGDVTFSVVGASTVEMTWNSDLVANVGMYTNAGTYDPQFTMSVSLGTEAIPALASGPEGIGALVARTNPNWGDSLQPLKTYIVEIKSSTQHGDGGSMTTSFKTGNAPATVSESEVSSTARTVVITLADTSVGGNTKITHQLVGKDAEPITETILFDENKQFTVEYADLTPLTEYTFTVIVLTDYDIPSLPASVSFKQKPNEPTPIVESDVTITNDTAAVVFVPVEGVTYILEIFKDLGGEWGRPVATYTYPGGEGESSGGEGESVTHIFKGLKPNGEYKVTMKTRGTVGNDALTTAPVKFEFQLFACSKATLKAHGVTIAFEGADAEVPDYLRPDTNVVFNITCPGPLVLDKRDAEGALTMVTDQLVTCTDVGWSPHNLPCVPEITTKCSRLVEMSAVYGTYTWPTTTQNKQAELYCYYNEAFKAKKICSERGVFEETNFADCPSAVASEIAEILEEVEDVTADTQDSVSEKIKQTTAESGEQMSSSDVQNTVQIIDTILDTPDIGISDTTLNNLMNTMDNVQTNTEVSEVRRDDTSDRLRESAVNIVGKIAETGKKDSKKDSFTPLNSIGFAVAAENIAESENKNFLALAGETNIINDSTNQDGTLDTYFRAEITTASDELATAVYYETDKAFPSNAISSHESAFDDKFQIIAGKIAGNADSVQQSPDSKPEEVSVVATVISDINIVDNISYKVVDADFSDRKFEMMFTVKDETELNVHRFTKRKTLVTTKLACKFYDTEAKLWSDEGCTTSMISYDEVKKEYDVTCICDHLTSFAVLMSFSSEETHLEELVSYILLAISLFFLLLTLLAILPNKKNLKARPAQVNLMLILALILSIVCFFLMDFFVSAEEDTEPSVPCSVIAFLLNYFWLCQLSWMIVEAVTMYIALVQVFGTYISKAILKYSLIGWSVPLIFPIIGIAWGGTEFADPKTCFIKYPYGLATFYGPVVLGVAVNWILFLFIARVLLRASKDKAKKTGDSNVKMRKKQLQSALAVSTLLGLSWIIGFFLLMNDSNYRKISLVFRWLFIALNAPQGFFIFVFYVLLKEDVRKFWLQKFRRKVKSPVSYTGTGSNDKGHRKKESTSLAISNDLQRTTFNSTGNDSLLLTNRHTDRSKPTTSASNVNKTKPLTPVSEVQMPLSVPLSLELSRTNENEYQDDEDMYCSPDELEVTFEPVSVDTDHVTVSLSTPQNIPPEIDRTSNPQLADDNVYAEDQVQLHNENMSQNNQIEQQLNSYEDVQPAAVQNEAVAKAQVQLVDSSDSEWDKASLESDLVISDLPELAKTSSLSVQTPQIEPKPQIEQHTLQSEQRTSQNGHQTPQSEQEAPHDQSDEQPPQAQSRGGGTSSNLGGPLLNFHLQCSLGGASRHLARTYSQVHFGLAV